MEDRDIPTHRKIQEVQPKSYRTYLLNNDSEDSFQTSELRLFHKVIVEGKKDHLNQDSPMTW